MAKAQDYTAEEYAELGKKVDNSTNPWGKKSFTTPEYEKNRDEIFRLYADRSRKAGPAPVSAYSAAYKAPTGPSQAHQGAAAAALQASSDGKGPSVASHVAGQGVDDAIRARMAAQAAVPRGASAGLASSAAGGAASAAMQSAAVQSALAKAQEVQAAQQAYAGLGTSMRGADIATAQEANKVGLSNAQLAQATSLQNQQAAIQWEAMGDAERNALLGMSMGLNQNEMTNRLNQQSWLYTGARARNAMSMQDRIFRDQQYAQIVGAGGTAASAYAKYAADDEQKDSSGLTSGLRR